ncbi:hypothetical protein MVEN_01352800 [Mycena venus]|uniref:ARM repeat-containing protein n=1 Tax=Mycena venus TaxID=2733690 RepID=A0A8H7CW80_9AGAR|nr:hypothetical protein MVEN_01352800 [Mycena venus]
MSYFQWDFVLWSTKATIFEDLAVRAESNVDEARAVVDSPDFYYITQMLKSPDIGARISSCRLLGSLARHECTMEAILELRTCAQLVSMLQDEDSRVIESAFATHTLSRIACHLNGAQAIVDSRALVLVSALLQSPLPNIQKWACALAGNLAAHEPTRAAVLALKPYEQIVPLLSDKDSEIVLRAAHALAQMARPLDGAQAIVDVGGLDHISPLLRSPLPNIREWTCVLVGNLAFHESTGAAILALKPFKTLVTLLSDKDSGVVDEAAHVLCQLACSLNGAQAIVDARGLDHVLKLLESPTAVLALKPFQALVTLLSDEDSEVTEWAAYALSNIAASSAGALAIVNARALVLVGELLESPRVNVRKWTRELVEKLASNELTLPAILELELSG